MDGNDYNLITPINSLQNIGSLQHVDRRKERKRKEKHNPQPQSPKETMDRETTDVVVEEPVWDSDDPHRIDFKA